MFQSRTEYDLEVEFWLDHFDRNPMEAHVNENGDIQFKDTGDDLLDKWEAQIANGETPDLDEAFSEEALEKLAAFYKKKEKGPHSAVKADASLADPMDSWKADAKKPGGLWQKVDTTHKGEPPGKKTQLPPTFGR